MSVSGPKTVYAKFTINTKTAPPAFKEAARRARISFEYEGTKFRKSAFGIHAHAEWEYADFSKATLPTALKKLRITTIDLRWSGAVSKKARSGTKPPELKVEPKCRDSRGVLVTAEVSENATCYNISITIIGAKSFDKAKRAFSKALNGQEM